MTEWHPATVAAQAPATDELNDVTLDISGTPLVGSHRMPGQYVRVRLPGVGEGVFAIASPPAPAGTRWDFLLKCGSPLCDTLTRLPVGAPVEVSRPEGRGFPLEQARGRHLLLFATGSGISAIRSVIESVREDRSGFGRVTLYFGARTPGAFAYREEFHLWESSGIRVVRAVSQPGASGWQGLTGYVQEHLAEEPVENTRAFICGQSEMVRGVILALETRGLPRGAIHLNY